MTRDLNTVHLDEFVDQRFHSDSDPYQSEEIHLLDGTQLYRVHPFVKCMGRHCTLHNPSDHVMKDWALNWRSDKGIFERICPHGIGHDDPDDIAYRRTLEPIELRGYVGIHGCDGCCAGKYDEIQEEDQVGWIEDNGVLRTFASGATRDTGEDKLEPWGFTSALVEQEYSEYMHSHRIQSDGEKRASDNWKKGIPVEAFHDSLSRHILDYKLIQEGFPQKARTPDLMETLLAIKFNVDGLIHELAKERLAEEDDD